MVANELALLQADLTQSLNTAGVMSLEDRTNVLRPCAKQPVNFVLGSGTVVIK